MVIIIKMDMNTEMGQSRVSPLRDRVNYSETHSSYDNMSSEATITDQIEQFEEERLAEIREKVKVIVFKHLMKCVNQVKMFAPYKQHGEVG